MTHEQLTLKIRNACRDIAPRMYVEIPDSLVDDLAFDYVETPTPSLEFYGIHSPGASREAVEFLKELIRSICIMNGIFFFYSPSEEDRKLYGT